jgi:hypothetical protein
MKEVLDHRNIGLGGLFDHVNFTQLLRKDDSVEMIQNALGLDNNTVRRIIRKDEHGIEIAIKIIDGLLNDFITMCACMISWIHSRLSGTVSVALFNALYKKGNLTELPPASFFSNFEREAFK